MKILAATNFLRAGRAWWGKERGDRGLRGGDRGLEGRGGGGNLFGGRQFFGKDASSGGGSCQFSCWLFS